MKIYFLNGDKAGQTLELAPPGISVGRETDNDVQLLVGGVSRYHAKIEFVNGAWAVRDLGSTNGTKVNGLIASGARTLQPGDIIVMGDQSIRFGEKLSSVISPALPTPPPSSAAPSLRPPASPGSPTIQEIPLPPPAPPPQFIFNPSPPAQTQPQPPPSPQPPPAPAAPQTAQADKDSHVKGFFDSFKNFGTAGGAKIEGDIFSKSKEQQPQQGQSQRKGLFGGRMGNLVFYVAVVGAAIIFVSIFIMMQQEPKKGASIQQPSRSESSQPFLLIYEKQRTTKDNIFRFTLKVEDGAAIFSLDDLKHNRHFYKSFGKANEAFLKDLEDAVKKTDFMKLEQEAPGVSDDGTDEMRSLIVGHSNNLKKIVVRNTYAKSSFEQIEHAIDRFAEDYQLKTVSIAVEDMKSEAEKAFLKAESLFDNYLASPENLREAILRYQLTMDYLDQFEPKPKEWDLARKRLQEAQTILDKQVKDSEFSIMQLNRLRQYKKAAEECQKLMDMVDPDSKTYKKAREYKIAFERQARLTEKR